MTLLSVVLPVYNVEEYLGVALDSLARQTHQDIEVVMVDDGSTDGSTEIAARFAEKDSRFRLIQQKNSGLGHARNTALPHVTGDYLHFVDSDDIVPHYAYRMIIDTLEQTGSDFLSGNEYRFDFRGATPAPMLEGNFALTYLRTNVSQRPTLMRDLLPHNKVYRKSFWDAHDLRFPEGILFEDGPVSVKAHALAASVDVISTPMYYWRLRDGASKSLSQLSDDPRFFVDRIAASAICADFLAERRPDLLEDFFTWDIRHKFTVMFKALPAAPPHVQELYMNSAVPHLQRTPAAVLKSLPPALQRRVELTRDNDLAGLLKLLPAVPEDAPRSVAAVDAAAAAESATSSAARSAKRFLGRSHTLRTVRAFARQTPASAAVKSAVMEVDREGDEAVLRGYAYFTGLPADGGLTARNRVMWARHESTRNLVRLRVRPVASEQATSTSRDPQWSYAKAGFEARLPLRQLRDGAGWRYGAWVLAVGAVTPRGVARGGLRLGPDAYRADLTPIELDEDAWLVPTVTNGVLGFRIEPADLTLVTCLAQDGKLVLTGRLAREAAKDAVVTVGLVMGVAELAVPIEPLPDSRGHHMFRTTIDLAQVVAAVSPVAPVPIGGQPDRLLVGLRTSADDLTPHPFACEPNFASFSTSVAGHRIAIQASADGWLALTVRRDGPTLESVSWTDDDELRLTGSGADLVERMQLVGRHSGMKQQRVLPLVVNPDGTWESQIHPERVAQVGGHSALRAGNWFLVLRTAGQDGGALDCDLPFAPELFAGAAHFRIPHGEQYTFRRVGLDCVALRIESRLREDERSAYHAQRLREQHYPAVRAHKPLRDVVVYDSFNGKQYSDSPRAVYEELLARRAKLEHLWVTRDAQAPVPDGAQTVEANSREYFEALATSRYVVANTHLPPWFVRRKGQVVAQTWHGIGFKRVAFDMDSVQFANKTYLDKLLLEAPNWSFLVSPSSFCTEIMRRAFRYTGEIAEIGSPRNDILISGDHAAAAAAVRAELGIAPDRKLLLYAPTWRDNEYYGPGMYKFNMQLDVARLPEHIRREYALLVRRHPNTVDDLLGYDSDFVYDVANYPDARDLLAAADVLITDYSTIALDFVNTGRPILFYTYDLENYRDNLRGFYFDLENEGPGPILQTTAEVAEALGNLDKISAEYRSRYERFSEIFCHAEDGHATARLVDRLLRES